MIKRIPKWIWLICAAFLVMQYLICLNVYMMGDDYMYGTFGHEGIVSSVFSYYLTGNGRWLVNIIDGMSLFFDRYLYVIVNPWLLLLLGTLLYHFISTITGKKHLIVFAASLISISVISILMTCEIFYWITGAMNYLVPALFLLASMTAVVKMRTGGLNKGKQVAYSLVCIISCLMMEQYGLMTIGWMLLVWGWDLLKTRKLIKANLAVFLISIIGLATIVFAPANSVRFDNAAATKTSLVIKIMDLIYYDYYSVVSSTLVFIIVAYCGYKFYCAGKFKLSIISCVNAIILLFVFNYKLPALDGGMLLLLAIISLLMSLITVVPYVISLYRDKNIIYIIALFIIGIGSQIMLLKTDLWGFRTSFSWILLYLIVLLTIVADKADMKEYAIFACVSCIAINPYMGLIGVALLVIMCLKNKTVPVLVVISSLLVIVTGLSDETLGYKDNSQIHKQNMIAAVTAKQHTKIEIQEYKSEQYGWNSPPFSIFHERYFRSYYGIPDDVSIEYVEEKQR